MIKILLSTYNGAQFLAEQIESILAQTYHDWQLVVRDDGSTDDTCAIIDDYCAKYPQKIVRQFDGLKNLGAMRSFEQLLTANEADYYMFCDQDDVWMAEKLQVCMEKMQQCEFEYGLNTPIVVHTDLMVVDSALQIIAKSFWKYAYIKPMVLNKRAQYLAICNSVTGCTMMFNQAARKVSLPFGEKALMHDSAIAVSTMLNKGKVVPIQEQTMLYRQHENNVAGACTYKWALPFREKYNNARRQYEAYHPAVFSNVCHFLFWKVCCFIAERLSLNGGKNE